jgi:uncharacterized membrane protein YdjX (TVP38/TMEM64 family)
MSKPNPILRLALILLLSIGLGFALFHRASLDGSNIRDALDDYGRLAPFVYVVAHVLASILFLPRIVMGVAAGLLFGLYWGSVWSLAGATAGALAGFLAARFINSGLLVIEELPRVGPLIRRVEADGWRAVFVARIIPVLPHSLVNYALGLTRISPTSYLVGSVLGMLPTAIVYVNLGATGRSALSGAADWVWQLSWGLGLLLLSFVAPRVLRLFSGGDRAQASSTELGIRDRR